MTGRFPSRSILAACVGAVALTGLAGPALADGDVAAVAVGRHGLRIDGDAAANDVVVERAAEGGGIVVRGRNGTTVNGQMAVEFPTPRKLDVALGDGDDVLSLGAVRLRTRLRVDLGAGDDRCELYACTLRGRTTIETGDGDDEVVANAGTRLGRVFRVSTDLGADTVRVEDCTVNGALRVLTGDGDDAVTLLRNGVTHTAPVTVRTGRDADTVLVQGCTFQNGVRVLTLDGEDDITVLTSHFEKGLYLDTGDEYDTARMENSSFDGPFKMRGGTESATAGAELKLLLVQFRYRGSGSSGDGKYFWSVTIIHVF